MNCPYYDELNNLCNFFDSRQDDYQKNTYCKTSSNWTTCINYTNRSWQEKSEKKLRPKRIYTETL